MNVSYRSRGTFCTETVLSVENPGSWWYGCPPGAFCGRWLRCARQPHLAAAPSRLAGLQPTRPTASSDLRQYLKLDREYRHFFVSLR